MTETEVWNLPTRHLGQRVLVFDQIDSTNSFAAALAADPANAGVAVLAREQTAGRGQHGRSWSAPPNVSVLLSILLFPPPDLRRPAILTAWAAVAVCKIITQLTGDEPTLKWPNDVFLHRRKVCGILIEQGQGVVAGIGLNVRQTDADFAALGLPQATSLFAATGSQLEPSEVARLLLQQLDADYDRLCKGDRRNLESSWRRNLDLVSKRVRVECAEGWRTGELLEMSLDGVVLRLPDGDFLHLVPERIQHLTAIDP